MEQFFDWVERSFIPWAGRLSGNKYMTAIRDTFYRLIPFFIVLYAFHIVQWAALDPEGPVMGENGMGLGAAITGGLYGEEYQATGFYRMARLFSDAIGISELLLLLFLTMTLAIQLTKIWGGDKSLAAFCALGGFFMFTQMEGAYLLGDGIVPLGHPPLRIPTAFLFAVLSARFLSWFDRFPYLRLNVPETLPERVAKPLERCVPAGMTLILFLLFCIAVTQFFVSYYNEVDYFIQTTLRPAAQTLSFALIYEAAVWFGWWCGLFGDGFWEFVYEFAYLPAQVANHAAASATFAQGNSLTHGFVFTSEFFRIVDDHVLSMAASVLVFSSNRRWRRVTWFMLPFLVFNIAPPFFFCLPVVLNPALLLPFVIAPMANTVVAWAAISWGIVPVFQFFTAYTMPPILQGVMGTGSLMGGVLQTVLLVLDVFIYAPFVIVANRVDKAQEGKGDAP